MFPVIYEVLKEGITNKEEIEVKMREITEKFFNEDETQLDLSIKDLSSQFRMKEHRNHKLAS